MTARWTSTFVRNHDDGSCSSSSRTFVGDDDAAVAGAAITDAAFWKNLNAHDQRVVTYVERDENGAT